MPTTRAHRRLQPLDERRVAIGKTTETLDHAQMALGVIEEVSPGVRDESLGRAELPELTEEVELLRPHHLLFTYLHLAPNPDLTKGLVDAVTQCMAAPIYGADGHVEATICLVLPIDLSEAQTDELRSRLLQSSQALSARPASVSTTRASSTGQPPLETTPATVSRFVSLSIGFSPPAQTSCVPGITTVQCRPPSAVVVRAYETAGRPCEATIEVLGRTVPIAFGPAEIRTFLVPSDPEQPVVLHRHDQQRAVRQPAEVPIDPIDGEARDGGVRRGDGLGRVEQGLPALRRPATLVLGALEEALLPLGARQRRRRV